ncbi:MAG: beta-propeller fold lactonase family protein [Acidobacteria bacterium]|nr:beta-propeller fold lactonase family protein [Acidobacteriota bacterium]
MKETRWILLCFFIAILLCCRSTEEAFRAPEARGAYRIYVTNEASGDLSVIDSASHEVIATVKLGKRPRGIHASPDASTIYVALSGSPFAPPGVDESKLPPPDRSADGIGVFDVRASRLLRVIPAGDDPEEFDLSKDGKLLYVANEDAGSISIVDIESAKVIQRLKVGGEPEGVTTSPDGKFVYVTSEDEGAVFVLDTSAAKVVKNFKVGLRPRDVAFLSDGRKAYVTCENEGKLTVIDAAKHEKAGEIRLGGEDVLPMAVILSPDAAQAYVSTGRTRKVFVIDTATDRIVSSFEAGQRPWGIGVSPDGKLLYTANGPSNDVSVVDLASRTVLKRIKVQDRPWGILVLSR